MNNKEDVKITKEKGGEKYEVWIDDNYSAMYDPDSYFKSADFEHKEDALKYCEDILINSLAYYYKTGSTFDDTVKGWLYGGEDPFIISTDCSFSARKFIEGKSNDVEYFQKIKDIWLKKNA